MATEEEKKQGEEQSLKDHDCFNMEGRDREVGVCVWVYKWEGCNNRFPPVRRAVPPGGGTLSLSTEEGEEALQRKGQPICGGGYLRGEMKESAAGYQANELPLFPSLTEI